MNIRRISIGVGLIAAGTLLIAGDRALAATFGPSSDDPAACPGGDCSLQNLLDDITLSGPGIDAVEDQTGYELFTNTATGNPTATFMFEFSEIKEETNAFGIYNLEDPLEMIQLFDGENFSSAGSTVYFGTEDIVVWTGQFSPVTGGFLFDPPPDFNVFDYDWNRFGFYLERGDGTTFYTQSILNPGGLEQAVVYRGDDETVLQMPGRPPGTFTESEFIIAFEDMALASGSDADYNDLVVIVGLIEPIGVPEPRAIAGLVLIVISLASSVIAKKIKKTIINYDLDF